MHNLICKILLISLKLNEYYKSDVRTIEQLMFHEATIVNAIRLSGNIFLMLVFNVIASIFLLHL